MINYTYKLIRNEGDEKVVYEPKMIPQELPSLSYIEGPNSSGKSTLLNIIALGFKGNNRKDISKALINKMNSLMDNSYQQLSFEVTIEENDTQLIISKDLESDQVVTYEYISGKRKPIDPEDKYNLIYDIPDDPINRLRQLTVTISNNQRYISHRISEFETFLRNQLDLAINSRNPKTIEELESAIRTKKIEYDILNEEINKKNEYLDSLEKYTYSKFYKEYMLRVKNIEVEIDKLNKDLKKSNKKNVDAFRNERKKMSEYQRDIIDYYYELTPIVRQVLKDEKNIQNLWGTLEKYIDDIFSDLEISSNVTKIVNSIEAKFMNNLSNSNNKELFVEVDTWKKIINLLSSLNKKDSLVPGVNKSIVEFIHILEDEISKNRKIVEKQAELEEGLKIIRKIREDINYLENKILPKVKESNDAAIKFLDTETYVKQKIENKVSRKEELKDSVDFYVNECINKGINITNESDLINAIEKIEVLIDSDEIRKEHENVLIKRISNLKDLIIQEQNKISNLKTYIEIKENELINLKNKDPYIYQEYLPQLKNAYNSCRHLNSKFKKVFEIYIDKIINEDSNINPTDELQIKYYDSIATYLGRKIGEIKYIDKLYKVKRVDIVKKVIITDNNKVIRYEDMGTGQSQSAYFLGKLNSIDNRKVIVLIDEVAMMDKSSLEPIFNKLKELHKNGKLIAGMIVQKAEVMSVIEIEG